MIPDKFPDQDASISGQQGKSPVRKRSSSKDLIKKDNKLPETELPNPIKTTNNTNDQPKPLSGRVTHSSSSSEEDLTAVSNKSFKPQKEPKSHQESEHQKLMRHIQQDVFIEPTHEGMTEEEISKANFNDFLKNTPNLSAAEKTKLLKDLYDIDK